MTATADHDKIFIRNFMIVLAVLVGIAIVSLLAAWLITTLSASGQMRPEQMTRVQARTAPVYRVNTDPNATQVASSAATGGGGEPMSGKQVFQNVCTSCHTAGVMGAPKVSNTAEWNKRLSSQGKDTLYKRSINGYKQMPAKGGNTDLSKQEMHNAVDYILSEAGAA